MGFQCGILGLPNVGKSTLFNALTQTAAAQAANYPFCTIEPNVGRVAVPDERLDRLATLASSQKVLATQIDIVDIAGLVRGASRGEGLGNKFLGNIREVDALIHVLRCFEDGDVTHVEGSVDPLRDLEIIETELMLADYESLERRQAALSKKAKGGDKESKEVLALVERLLPVLHEGKPARSQKDLMDQPLFKQLQLLTSKPILYVCNVSEGDILSGNAHVEKVKAYAASEGSKCVIISAAIESEIATLPSAADQREFLASLGLAETGLSQVIRQGYELLGLLTFFTVGPKEARAWTVRNRAKAPEAAGVIHSDFERGFICAETISCADFFESGSEQAAKAAGKVRLEGKEYLVQDGDVFHFRFNV